MESLEKKFQEQKALQPKPIGVIARSTTTRFLLSINVIFQLDRYVKPFPAVRISFSEIPNQTECCSNK